MYPPPEYVPPPPYPVGPPDVPRSPLVSGWSSGLCDCCIDIPNCCLTCFCPCITFGQIAEIVDRGSTSCGVHGALYALIHVLTGCGCLYSCTYRTKMRRQYGLLEAPSNDFCLHFCCEPCALCQDYRELKHLGFDMSIGWQDNNRLAQRNHGIHMPPTTHGGMQR